MSDRDFWERINDATDRAIDMAHADRILARIEADLRRRSIRMIHQPGMLKHREGVGR